MRTLLLSLPIVLFACSGDKDSTDTEDTGTPPPPPECDNDLDCASFSICSDETCVMGDRNNSTEEAETLLWGDEATGFLQTPDDEDFYSFEAEGGEFIRITTAHIGDDEDMNTILTLYSPIGKVQQEEDESGAGSVPTYDSIINAYLPTAGTWVVRVQDVEGGGSITAEYELVLDEYNAHTSEEDSLESPSYTVEVSGSGSFWAVGVLLEEEGDVDYIELDLPYDNCPIYLYGSTYTDGTDATPTVELLDINGDRLLRMEDVGPGGTGVYPEVSGGTATIAAMDVQNAGGENHWFFVYLGAGDEGSPYLVEMEPNDSIEDSNTMEFELQTTESGETYKSYAAWGLMDYEDDSDWYMLEAEQDEYLTVWGTGNSIGSQLNAQIEIVDYTGTTIASETEGDDNFPDLSDVQLDAGIYFVKVTHEEGDGVGPDQYYRFSAFLTAWPVSR